MQPVALGRLLELAEDASPVDAVEAVARGLRHALGANAVSILIPDMSRRALVRLAQITDDEVDGDDHDAQGTRIDEEESASRLPLNGSGAAETAIRTQTVQVLPPGVSRDGKPPSQQWTCSRP